MQVFHRCYRYYDLQTLLSKVLYCALSTDFLFLQKFSMDLLLMPGFPNKNSTLLCVAEEKEPLTGSLIYSQKSSLSS